MFMSLTFIRFSVIAGLALAPSMSAALVGTCTPTHYSAAQITQAIQNSPYANQALKNNACTFGGTAMGESHGNACAANAGNTGVLQLNNYSIARAGYTPTKYANSPLQNQVNVWAQMVGTGNTSGGYTTLSNAIQNGTTIGSATPTTGMLGACFQFGPVICRNDISYMQSHGGACPSATQGGLNINSHRTNPNLDGNNQSICSWGAHNQPQITANRANCTAGCTAPAGTTPQSPTANPASQPAITPSPTPNWAHSPTALF